jgi:hypothetical protein
MVDGLACLIKVEVPKLDMNKLDLDMFCQFQRKTMKNANLSWTMRKCGAAIESIWIRIKWMKRNGTTNGKEPEVGSRAEPAQQS